MRKKRFEDVRRWHRYQFFGSAVVTVMKERKVVQDATIANVSFSGVGLYSPTSIGRGKNVHLDVSFIDRTGKIQKDRITGKVDWQKKFGKMYIVGILFDEEPNVMNQPRLVQHLTWLIDTYKWPQPYSDKRIAML